MNEIQNEVKPLNPYLHYLKKFYGDLVGSLSEPTLFFKERYPKISFTHALAFGVATDWIANFLNWLTRIVRHETLMDGLLKIRHQLEALPFWKSLPSSIWAQVPDSSHLFPAWLTEIAGVALSPFQSLFRIVTSGLIIWLGSLLLISKSRDHDSIDLKSAMKLVALCTAPHLLGAILGFLPLNLGSFFAWIYGICLIVFALSLRYQISKLRSLGVLMLPGILLSVVGTCFLGLIVAVFFGAIAAIFGGS